MEDTLSVPKVSMPIPEIAPPPPKGHHHSATTATTGTTDASPNISSSSSNSVSPSLKATPITTSSPPPPASPFLPDIAGKFHRSSTQHHKYKGTPSIIDEPQLVELCEHYTTTKNITGLSLIARQKGLPPHLRHLIWPLLLKNHPFVLKPYILPDEIEEEIDEKEIKSKIKYDLRKYFRRNRNHFDMAQQQNTEQSTTTTENKPTDTETETESDAEIERKKIEDEIMKVIQHSILRFMKKWGSLINYHSGLTWIALGLAEWIPPLSNNNNSNNPYDHNGFNESDAEEDEKNLSNYVLCGREFVNKNKGSCLKNINDELKEYSNYVNYNFSDDVYVELNGTVNHNSNSNNGHSATSSTIFSNGKKQQQQQNHKQDNDNISDDNSSATSIMTFTTTHSHPQQQQQQTSTHTSSTSPQKSSNGHGNNNNNNNGKNLSFAEIYERMALVILHSPEAGETSSEGSSDTDNDTDNDSNDNNNDNNDTNDNDNDNKDSNDDDESPKEKILTTLPVKGGTAEERISFFLYCLRRLLPELAQFFADEDILNTTTVKDEWVVWWLKWCGAKVWSKYDRGRLWDLLLGWRNFDSYVTKDEELNDMLLDNEICNLLGPDLFWHPLAEDDEQELRKKSQKKKNDQSDDDNDKKSIKSLISSLSNVNLNMMNQMATTSDSNNSESYGQQIKKKIPFANLDPHTEIVFISLSFMKSKEFAILELEQSEIREFLNKASSNKLYGFQELFEDEINKNSNTSHHHHQQQQQQNYSSPSSSTDDLLLVAESESQEQAQQQQQQQVLAAAVPPNKNSPHRNGLRDIENIIMESGELWRKWVWQEVSD